VSRAARVKAAKPFGDSAVAAVFERYPPALRARLLALRGLIFDTAAATEGVGELEETLKWGQPSYLTTQSRSGSTIRIDSVKSDISHYTVYFNCQTDLVATFREIYPKLNYEGNRAVILDAADDIDQETLRHCFRMALTYHRRKRQGAA
jgi:hypothetical protein